MALEPRRRFRFLQELSEGSFGKVYLAEMITGDSFSTVVAIKLLHGKWLGHEEIVMRSRDEARLLGLLRHQNIIRVEDLTSINGQCAVIMEYLEGVDLKNLLTFVVDQGEVLPRRSVLEITSSIASALEAAYNHKPLQGGEPLRVIHRDIKPSNVMVTAAGEVKVLDFGTARANFDDREAQTQALSFGSQAYMAPERMMGDPDTPAADIFSLGVTIYELLKGERFGKIYYRRPRFQEALDERLAGLDLSQLPSELEPEVREYLATMMAYSAEDRPSARDVMDRMEELAESSTDMGLRRLCRLQVPKAHAVRPVLDTGDPLTGSTLVEDTSSAFVNRAEDSGAWLRSPEEDGEPAGEQVEEKPFPPSGARRPPRRKFRPEVGVVEDLPQGGEPPAAAEVPEPPVALGAPEAEEPAPPAEPLDAPGADDPEPLTEPPAAYEPEPAADAPEPLAALGAPEAEEPAPPAEPLDAPPEPEDVEPPAAAPDASAAAPDASAAAPDASAAAPDASAAAPDPQAAVLGAPEPDLAEPPPEPERPEPLAEPLEASPEPEDVEPPVSLAAAPEAQAGAHAEPDVVEPSSEPPAKSGGRLRTFVVAILGLAVLGGGASVILKMTSEPAASGPPASMSAAVVTMADVPPERAGTMILRVSPAGAAEVTVTNMLAPDFRDVWDGMGNRVFEGVHSGTYTTKLTPAEGASRRATVDVLQGQRCTYVFDMNSGSEEWRNEGCE